MKTIFFHFAIIALIFLAIPYLSSAQTDATQDPAQMAADQAACQEHAKASSGYDPANPQAFTSEQSPPPQRGAGLRGAARGAAGGALAGEAVERVGDEGEHDDAAEVGAAIGGVTGGLRARRQVKEQAEVQQAQTASSGASAYTKSYNECMTLRGYSIN